MGLVGGLGVGCEEVGGAKKLRMRGGDANGESRNATFSLSLVGRGMAPLSLFSITLFLPPFPLEDSLHTSAPLELETGGSETGETLYVYSSNPRSCNHSSVLSTSCSLPLFSPLIQSNLPNLTIARTSLTSPALSVSTSIPRSSPPPPSPTTPPKSSSPPPSPFCAKPDFAPPWSKRFLATKRRDGNDGPRDPSRGVLGRRRCG